MANKPIPEATQEAVIREYVDEKRSTIEIGARHDLTRWLVTKILTEAGVELRGYKESANLAKPKHVVPFEHRPALVQLVDGLMLGDGNITKTGELCLAQSVVREGWVNQVGDLLGRMSIIFRVRQRAIRRSKPVEIRGREVKGGDRVDLRTLTYEFFFEQRQRWYPEGTKIVPRDLVLTPFSVAHWFAGDGSPWSNGGLCFCTQCFTRDDCVFLKDRLKSDLGVESNLINANVGREHQFVIHIGQRNEAMKLREAIHDLVAECCQYKFDKVRWRLTTNIDWDTIDDLGLVPDSVIAKRLNVPVTTVAYNRQVRGLVAARDRGRAEHWTNAFERKKDPPDGEEK